MEVFLIIKVSVINYVFFIILYVFFCIYKTILLLKKKAWQKKNPWNSEAAKREPRYSEPTPCLFSYSCTPWALMLTSFFNRMTTHSIMWLNGPHTMFKRSFVSRWMTFKLLIKVFLMTVSQLQMTVIVLARYWVSNISTSAWNRQTAKRKCSISRRPRQVQLRLLPVRRRLGGRQLQLHHAHRHLHVQHRPAVQRPRQLRMWRVPMHATGGLWRHLRKVSHLPWLVHHQKVNAWRLQT